MSSCRVFVIVFVCLYAFAQASAQGDIYTLQEVNVKDGLPNSNNYSILQDSNSFIWISSSGSLMRYDGYHFKSYDASFFNINERSTLSIALDNDNLIWFCERLASLKNPQSGVFNPVTEKIIDFKEFSNGLFQSQDVISLNASLYEEGVIYITTVHGIVYKYDGSFNEIYNFGDERVFRVVSESDSMGNYWIVHNNTQILKIDKEQQVVESYTIGSQYLILNKIIATNPVVVLEGLDVKLDKEYWQVKKGVLAPYQKSIKRDDFQVLKITDTDAYYFQNDTVYKEVFKTSSTEQRMEPVAAIPDLKYNYSFRDRQGITWLTSSNGIYKIIEQQNLFRVLQNDNSIRAIYKNNDELWIGGYIRNVSHHLVNEQERELNFKNIVLTSIIKDADKNLWIGTNTKTIFKKENYGNRIVSYNGENAEALQIVFQNPETGKIWVGKSRGVSFINKYDKLTSFNGSKELNDALVRQFFYTDQGIWIVTNKGLFLMDASSEKITKHYSKYNGLPVENINHLYKDSQNILWLASRTDGLVRWDVEANSYKVFNSQQGLSNNTIYAVYEDDHNYLWLPSNYGLMRFNKETYNIQTYTDKDGIANNEFNTLAHFKDNKGRVYYGGITGITSFHPRDFMSKTVTENPIYVSNVSVLTKNAQDFKSIDLSSISTDPIALNYDDQTLKFEVNLLDYKSIENQQYAYKIEGYHNQWIYTDDYKISIFNFPYGEHIIRIKAKGSTDSWTNDELQFSIAVDKPFYLKWYYIVLAVMIIIGLIYLYLKRRIIKLNRARLELEFEVQLRTQQIENDREIIKAQAEDLKALDVAKGRFFANLTHEFRTPLTLIIGPLEQIVNDPPPPAILKRRASGILNNAKHILGLINQLLDLAKLESKQMPIDLINADVILHTSMLLERFQPLILQHRQVFSFQHNLKEWIVNFDIDKWDKIIYNLVSNAIKFTPQGGQIDVVLNSVTNEGENFIELQVKDSGVGIEAKNIGSIFNRFYQVDLSSTRANDGTGIGLSLVKELVDLQEGNISVTSKINNGTTFKIILPLHEDAVVSSHISNLQNQYLLPIPYQKETVVDDKDKNVVRLDILLVEDNQEISDYIAQCLGSQYYSFITASNGEEGLQKALSLIPDLIISDVMMPLKSGFELVEDLRNHISTSHIPIILLTAKTTLDNKLQGLKRGADAYLTKPFSPRELDIRVRNLIENRKRLQERYTDKEVSIEGSFEKEDKFILQLQEFIKANLSQSDLNGDLIGLHFGLSRIHLYRKLKALTNVSISEFVKDLRLEKGMELVRQKQLNVSEIAYEIGFTSPSHFSRSFKDKYGKSPSQV